MTTKVLNFPNNENPLTDGGAGAGTLINTVSATWPNAIVATGGSPGHILGPGATGTDDALAKFTGTWGPIQTCTGTIWRTGDPVAAETEMHTRMTMVVVGAPDDQIFTYEYDATATVMALARWEGPKAQIVILFSPTIPELIDGDVVKGTVVGPTSNATLEYFINGVSQGTGNDTSSIVPITGTPGIGLDNDAGTFGFKGYTATDGLADSVPPIGRFIAPVLLW